MQAVEHAKAIRQRLISPPNAVPDAGINLSRARGISGYQRERELALSREQANKRLLALAIERSFQEYVAEKNRKIALCQQVVSLPLAPTVRVEHILKAMWVTTGLTPGELQSARRTQDIIIPRHLAIMLCRLLTNKSFPEIGRIFGGRDHTTILHAVRKMQPVEDIIRAKLAYLGSPVNCAYAAIEAYCALNPGKWRLGEIVVSRLQNTAA